MLLSDDALAACGIKWPKNILMQRSAFGDRRPTIFVVKRFLPEEFSNVWQNVNITFDNQFIDSTVKLDPDISWRKRLPISDQAAAMARGRSLGSSLNAPHEKTRWEKSKRTVLPRYILPILHNGV